MHHLIDRCVGRERDLFHAASLDARLHVSLSRRKQHRDFPFLAKLALAQGAFAISGAQGIRAPAAALPAYRPANSALMRTKTEQPCEE
jgi:hypothetical protein